MKKTIEYVPYNPFDIGSEDKTVQLIECFRDVFAAPPWGEYLKCPNCGFYFSNNNPYILEGNLKHVECNTDLVDFWPREEVRQDLEKQITPNSSAFLAMEGDKVVGFTWGYPMKIRDMVAELGLLKLVIDIDEETTIFYQDEVGVLEEYRGKKIAKKLVYHRTKHFMENNPDVSLGFVRTRKSPEPSITYLWYVNKLGYSTVAEYEDGRVVLQKNLHESNFLSQLV